MEQHITKYTEFYSRNGSFSGGGDSPLVGMITGLGAFGIIELNNFVNACVNFLKLIDRNFSKLVDSGTKTFDEICNIALRALNNGNYSKINDKQISSFYGAFDRALQTSSPAFYGGADCDCGANVMSYWTNSAYLVFKGGAETEKNVAFMIVGINTLADLIEKSMKSRTAEFNDPAIRELMKLYMDAIIQLKKAVGDVNSELMKKNANMKKDFDTYAKLTPEEIVRQLEYKVKNNAARAEFLSSIKLLAPTAYYSSTLKDAVSKLGIAVKDFEEANTNGKFNEFYLKMLNQLSASDASYDKIKALEFLKSIHQQTPMKFDAAAEVVIEPPQEAYVRDYSFLGGGGESIFGGELLELDKKVDILSKAENLYESPLEISFRTENERMLIELFQTAQVAAEELYQKKSITDDQEIINFLAQLDSLRVVDLDSKDFQNMFFRSDNIFGIGYSRDAYLSNLENIISIGKSIEGKIGSNFSAFIKYLERYRQFLIDSSNKLSNIVTKKGFNAKFFGGLYTQWSYTMSDVIKTFTRGIIVSQMRVGLEHSIKELENYNKDQSDMNAKIMGREINLMVKICGDIMENVVDHANFPIPKELTKVIIQENLDGFIQLQRASQALNEKCRTYQMQLVKNPTKAREISDLLKKVAIDINSIGDESFKHLTDFLEYFHVESVAVNDNKYKDINDFNKSNGLGLDAAQILTDADMQVVPDANKHKLEMYNNSYLGKQYGEPTPYPIKVHDVLASHVPTMICATTDGKFIKKSQITGDKINAYGGKRILPSKTTNAFGNVLRGATIDADGNYGVAGHNVAAGFNHANEYAVTLTIAGPTYLPKNVKFLSSGEIINNYNQSSEHLNKGIRQITSLKNLFSVFQSIDKAYESEKPSNNNQSMKIGEIYECFVNYIAKTTRYPVLYKIKVNNSDKYVCSHIALRKFGYDPIIPCNVGGTNSFRTTKNNMFNLLDKLSLREYFDGADYSNAEINNATKWSANSSPFPKTGELLNYQNKNAPTLDKTYFSNSLTLSGMFNECDNLCVMSLKSVVCKIFTVLSLFNVINLDDLKTNLPFNQLRAIYGGLDMSSKVTPPVDINNCELYVRMYLLMLFYKGLFFEEEYGAGQQHIIAGAKRMAVLPGNNGAFDELLKFMFLRNFNNKLFTKGQSTRTGDIVSFGIFVDICNKIAEKYKGSSIIHIQKMTIDLVDEINRRYGIVSTDQIKDLMQKEQKRQYPGIMKLAMPLGKQLTNKFDRLPPTLLDGENSSFRDTKVDSDSVQFGETTVGRILTLINPQVDKFNMSEILAVVYNFRKKLDMMTASMDTELNRRNNATIDIYKQNNISNKCRVLKRQLMEYIDNRGKLEFLMGFFVSIGKVVDNNINNEEIAYRELVFTPCSILNKLYNRLIGMSNLYGKQTYNNILNLNTHFYDLNSINTDLVRVIKTSDMPKLDFSLLAKTCDEYLEQIILFHKQYVVKLTNTDNKLDKTINMLINQHNYIWHPDGPLSDATLDYKSIVYVPLNDYSEFPNVLYNAGTENLIGTNSWTAYKGKDIYDDPIMISDPRNKIVRSTRPGRGGEFQQLEMSLLSQRFSPKNIYQLFEYVLICMYRVFYEPTGVVYQPLFSDFVNKLTTVIDFQNIIINDADQQLGGTHGFQKGLPFSNKIAAIYRLIYSSTSKSTATQSDITLLPSESIQAMKDYLCLFIFLLKHIITQAYVHSQILAINRYSGGDGLNNADANEYTQGTTGTYELFPVIGPGGVATYADYYEKLTRGKNANGLGMRIYSGYEPTMSLAAYPKLQDLKTLGLATMAIDRKVNTALTAAQNINAGGFSNLSFNNNVTANFAAGKGHSNFMFLNKYQDNDAIQLISRFDINTPNNLTDLKTGLDKDDANLIRNKLRDYYDKGINQNYLQVEAAQPAARKSAKGNSLEKAYYDVFNNDYFERISTFCKKYVDDVVNSPGFLYAPATNKDTVFSQFINGIVPTETTYNRFNLITEFGITVSNGGEMIFPSRNFHCNSYMECANNNEVLAMAKNIRKKITTGLSDPINIVASTLHAVAVAAPVNAIAIAGVDNFGVAGNYVVYEDSDCTKPASGESGLAGRKIYVKFPDTSQNANFYGLRMNNHGAPVALGPDVVRNKCANGCTFAGRLVNLGNAAELSNDTLINVFEFIDGICTSRSRYGISYAAAADKDIVEVIGLIPDALLMFNKYIKLNNTPMTFEEYLPNFIMERIDLLLGKDYEAMIDIFGALNPSIYATINRRVACRNGGAIQVTDRPVNLNAGTRTVLAGFTGGAITRDIFSKAFGQTINGVHYLPHTSWAAIGAPAANGNINDMDINEAPGAFQICVNGIHKQSNIYNQFKYTDCNPFYDALLSSAPLKIFTDNAAAGTIVNSATRVSSATPGRLTVLQQVNRQYYNCASNKNILGAVGVAGSEELFTVITDDIITDAGLDKSHNSSMNGINRVQSSAYDAVIPDHDNKHRSKYLCVIYEYIFKHIVCSANDKRFEDRYNKFKKKILDTFMKAYTPYESSDAFTAGISKNTTYSYVPVAARGNPRSVILGNTLHNHYIHNIIHPDMHDIFRLNLLPPPAVAEVRYIGNKQNSNTEGIYDGARRDAVGTAGANAIGGGGPYINMAGVILGANAGDIAGANAQLALADAPYLNMFNIEKSDFQILPDSLLIENGNFARGILVDTNSDTVIKNKYLGLINRIPAGIMDEINTTCSQFIVAVGGTMYSIYNHIICALSLSTDLFKQAMLALYKIMIYGYSLGIFRACLGTNGVTNLDILGVIAPNPGDPPALLRAAGVITDEVRKAIRFYNALRTIVNIVDTRLNGLTPANMVEFLPGVIFRTMTPNPAIAALSFTEADLWSNNDYIQKLGTLIDSLYFAPAPNDVGTTIFAVDYSGVHVGGDEDILAGNRGNTIIALDTQFDNHGFDMLFGNMNANAGIRNARNGYEFPLPAVQAGALANALAVPGAIALAAINTLPGVGVAGALTLPDNIFSSGAQVYDFGGGNNLPDHTNTVSLAKLIVVSLFSDQGNPDLLKLFPVPFATTVANVVGDMNPVLYTCRSLIFGYLDNIGRICTNPDPELMMFSYRHINSNVSGRIDNTFKIIDDINNFKYKKSLNSDLYFASSSIDQYFINAVYKNKCLYNISEAETYINTLKNRSFINKFITFKGLSTVFRKSVIDRLIDLNIMYSPILAAQGPTGGSHGEYIDYFTNDPHLNLRYLGDNAAYLPFVIRFNTTSSALILNLYKQIEEYKGILNNIYPPPKPKSRSAQSSFGQNITQPGKVVSFNHRISTLEDVPATGALAPDEVGRVDRNKVDKIVSIEKKKAPAFIDENYVDRNCLMRELAIDGVTADDLKARAKNAISFGMSLYKSLSAVYAELGDVPKYLHVDESLDDINQLVSRNERKTPITYAVELIPNIINIIRKDDTGADVEDNILKTPDVSKMQKSIPLGLKCRNIYDLNKFFNGEKSDLLKMIKPFLMADSIQPLTLKDFPWTEKVGDASAKNTLSQYIQITSKLIKYLYEIEFKSMFSNMFPIFNNLDNPKFDIVTAPGPGNPLQDMANGIECYGVKLNCKSLQTSIPGIFSFQYLGQPLNDIMNYNEMIELAFGRDATQVPSGVSTKCIGFTEQNMFSTQELIALLEIDSNSTKLSRIMGVGGVNANRIGTSNNIEQLLAENILDIGVFPINIHAMAKEIPMAELINNVYSYDIIMKWLLQNKLDPVKEVYCRSGVAANDPAVLNDVSYSRSRLSAPIGASVPDTAVAVAVAGAPPTELDITKNNLFSGSLYNYCINPFSAYVFPVGINSEHIIGANWLTLHPTLNGTSKLNKLTKSKLDNSVGLHSATVAAGAAPDHLYAIKEDTTAYTIDPVTGVDDANLAYILTEEYLKVDQAAAGGADHANKGIHLIDAVINPNEARADVMFPVQYNFACISKPDPAIVNSPAGAENRNFAVQTIDLSLGTHLSDATAKFGEIEIKKSKLVKSLFGNDKHPVSSIVAGGGATHQVLNRTDSSAATQLAVGDNVLTTNEVKYDKDCYYAKQRVGEMKTYMMDLMHGVDYECQQPVLGINIFADVLMNIYTAKLYSEIKVQRERSSQVSIGEAAVFDQYLH
jgi:hypothetical protein